jgi:septum formation protein
MSNPRVDFYLASGSPRRRDLLSQVGYRFATLRVEIDEIPARGESSGAFVHRMATQKAVAGWHQIADAHARPVLGADTVVVVDDQILGKPADAADAARMLALLSGRSHRVLTAVVLCAGETLHAALSETTVLFRRIEEDEIRRYWASGEPRDKAGAYAIQGLAAIFVARIEGSYSGVVGLPVFETATLLQSVGVSAWQQEHVSP